MKEQTVSPMTAKILEETRHLPPIMDEQLAREIWAETWGKYLEEMVNLHPWEDPRRAPPVSFWHRKVDI